MEKDKHRYRAPNKCTLTAHNLSQSEHDRISHLLIKNFGGISNGLYKCVLFTLANLKAYHEWKAEQES